MFLNNIDYCSFLIVYRVNLRCVGLEVLVSSIADSEASGDQVCRVEASSDGLSVEASVEFSFQIGESLAHPST